KSGCHNNIKNDIRKLKGKDTVDNAAQMSNATTMALGMYQLDLITLAPRVKNNRETYEYYLKRTMEQAAILREVVEQAKSQNPLDSASYLATRANTSGTGGNYLGQQRIVKCFNYQGEGHMVRQCPKPKRKKDATWFREKFSWLKLKEVVRFLLRKNWNSWQILAQQIRLMLYEGNVIAKETNVISIVDSEETLMLEEKSRSKMLLKQSDLMVFRKEI
nr:hypothetical protein [Tanacetum cinerariifolium]